MVNWSLFSFYYQGKPRIERQRAMCEISFGWVLFPCLPAGEAFQMLFCFVHVNDGIFSLSTFLVNELHQKFNVRIVDLKPVLIMIKYGTRS